MGGDGGGDGGYEAQQAAIEAKKQKARDALNLQFGVGDVSRDDFTTTAKGGFGGIFDPQSGLTSDGAPATQGGFDQAGFDTATADMAKNKAARDSLYSTVRDNAFTAGQRDLDDTRDKAQRDLKFQLFSQGLNGGSTDIDQNALLGRTYDKGLLTLGAKADAAKADLRSNDEGTRLGLLQSIDSGTDQGSALSSAINGLQVNADKANAEAQGTTLGDLFANAGLLYQTNQSAKGKVAGIGAYGTLFPSIANNGIISSTGGH